MPLPTPACPRCGYDMTGVVESWHDTCPLAGRCSECGLFFSWSDLLNPTLSVPPWSFEHAGRQHLRCWRRTAWRTSRGSRFWNSIRIEHPIRRLRLWIFALSFPLLTHLICALTMAGVELEYLLRFRPRTPDPRWVDKIAMHTLSVAVLPYQRGRGDIFLAHSLAWFLVIAAMIMPLPFLVLSDTFSLARVRFIHLFRVWAYSQPVVWSIAFLTLIADFSLYWSPPGPDLRFAAPALQLAALLWLINYWSRACRLYLRLPQVGLVLIAMATITILAAIAWMAYIQPVIIDIAE